MSFECVKILASLPRTERGKALQITGDPKGKNFLYTNGNSVFIRDVEDPSTCDVYTQHSVAATVAVYAPSGFYICSGDVSGKIRIWDTTQAEHVLKNEFHVLGGAVRGLAYSGDSQRLVVVGDGRERYGAAILADTGASCGEINGHSKCINAVDVRSCRPFRAATGGDDRLSLFYEGPPFKFTKQHQTHANFVNAVRFAPDGSRYASGGADGRVFLYDGKSGELQGQLGDPAHKGGVYGVSFSPDGTRLLSVSGDKSARVWQLSETGGEILAEFCMGSAVTDMQLGCLWFGQRLLSVSLSGAINYLDLNAPGAPSRVVHGHNKPVTALGVDAARRPISASSDGAVCVWDVASGQATPLLGAGHKSQVQALTVGAGARLYTVALDDTLAVTALEGAEQPCFGPLTKLASQPRGVAASPDAPLAVVACLAELLLLRDGLQVGAEAAPAGTEFGATALNAAADTVAVADTSNKKIHIYAVEGNNLALSKSIGPLDSAVTALAFSPDGVTLAATTAHRSVHVFSVGGDWAPAHDVEWCYHSGRVNCLAWAPNSRLLATGGLDCSAAVWNMDAPRQHLYLKNAHLMSQVNGVAWLDDTSLVTAAHDSILKVWRISV